MTYDKIINTLLDTDAYRVTYYLSPKHTIKAVRIGARKRRADRRDKRADVRLTVGTPNYLERKFIKLAVKAGEPFPINKLQIKYPYDAVLK